jgi:hypothetical protein
MSSARTMTTPPPVPTESIECPLCLGAGKLKRTEVLDRLGVKDFARVAQLSAEEAFRLLQNRHDHEHQQVWARRENCKGNPEPRNEARFCWQFQVAPPQKITDLRNLRRPFSFRFHPKTAVTQKHCHGSSTKVCPPFSPFTCISNSRKAQTVFAASASNMYSHERAKSSFWREHASFVHLQATIRPERTSSMYWFAMPT